MNKQYSSIQDAVAVTGWVGYSAGDTEIWYGKSEYMHDGFFGLAWLAKHGRLPKATDLTKTHVKIGSVAAKDKDMIYRMLQGEAWSPDGGAYNLIKASGVGHTSMSVGDVIVVDGTVWLVDIEGFVPLE